MRQRALRFQKLLTDSVGQQVRLVINSDTSIVGRVLHVGKVEPFTTSIDKDDDYTEVRLDVPVYDSLGWGRVDDQRCVVHVDLSDVTAVFLYQPVEIKVPMYCWTQADGKLVMLSRHPLDLDQGGLDTRISAVPGVEQVEVDRYELHVTVAKMVKIEAVQANIEHIVAQWSLEPNNSEGVMQGTIASWDCKPEFKPNCQSLTPEQFQRLMQYSFSGFGRTMTGRCTSRRPNITEALNPCLSRTEETKAADVAADQG